MKRNLLKVLGISFLIYVVLSWIIPVGTYSGGEVSTSGVNPIGLVSLFNTPITAFVTFALYGVVFAVMGGLYGVMEHSGALDRVVERLAKKFSGKEKKFLVLTIILFVVLSSLTGLVLPLFVLVPLFAYALMELKFDKVTALAATVGSILLGSVVSTYGFNITGYTKNLLSLDMNNHIVARLVLLVLLTVLYAVMLVAASKRRSKLETKLEEVKEEVEEAVAAKVSKAKKTVKTAKKAVAKKPTKKTTRKTNTKSLAVVESIKKVIDKKRVKAAPMVVLLVLMLLVAFVGMYNWYYAFGIEVFNKMHDAVMGVKIGDFAIFEKLFGGATQFGYWSNLEFAGLMIVTSMIMAWVYRMSVSEYVDAFVDGMKKWLPTALYATLASVILAVLYQALQGGSGTLVDTINGKLFGLVDGFNPIVTGVSAFLSSFFFNDLYYLLADMSSFVTSFDASALKIAAFTIQSVYAVAMMIFPTSVILIAGLSLFDVSYKKWLKYIWRFVLIAFLAVLLVAGILTLI